MTNRRRPLSVDPRDRHPLGCRVHALDRALQLSDRLVEVVVHDGQVEEVAVRLLQHVRLLRQSFQTAVELKRASNIVRNIDPPRVNSGMTAWKDGQSGGTSSAG